MPGSGGLAPQQGRGVWGAEPPSKLSSSDLSKFNFDQFGGNSLSIWGYLGAYFNQFRGRAKRLIDTAEFWGVPPPPLDLADPRSMSRLVEDYFV